MAHGMIVIDQDRCKGCGLCVPECPQHVIAIDEDKLNARGYHPGALVDPGSNCTGCAICAVICPDVCITVFRDIPVKHHTPVTA